MTRVAIIVLHFGKLVHTETCIASVMSMQTKIPYEIFVVDNGTDTINQSFFKKKFPNVKVLVSNKNLGYAEGNNKAILYAIQKNFSHYLLLNNDTTVSANILDELLKGFENKHIGIVGPVITYQSNPQKVWFAGGKLYKNFGLTKHAYMNKTIKILQKKPVFLQTDFITGAAIMIKKEVFKKIGLLPKDYFLYWEDVDFCYKAIKKGFLCALMNKPLVKHTVSAATGIQGTNKLSKLRAYYYARNPFIFIKNNNLPKVTGIVGQCAVFFYYIFQTENSEAAMSYIKGFLKGFLYLID